MKRCSSCNRENSDESVFCMQCGKPFSEQKSAPNDEKSDLTKTKPSTSMNCAILGSVIALIALVLFILPKTEKAAIFVAIPALALSVIGFVISRKELAESQTVERRNNSSRALLSLIISAGILALIIGVIVFNSNQKKKYSGSRDPLGALAVKLDVDLL